MFETLRTQFKFGFNMPWPIHAEVILNTYENDRTNQANPIRLT